jgi:hypothetical protein
MEVRFNPLQSLEQKSRLKQQVAVWNEPLDSTGPDRDEMVKGYPAVRMEHYGPLVGLMKDQSVTFASNDGMRRSAFEAGITISGQALLGAPGALLILATSDEGSLQAVFKDAGGQHSLPVNENPEIYGYVVDLPTGRQLSVSDQQGPLLVHSQDKNGQIASRFSPDSAGSTVGPSFSSVGDLDWQNGLTYIAPRKGPDGPVSESLQAFEFGQADSKGIQHGQVFGRLGPIDTSVDARANLRGALDESQARLQGQDPDAIVNVAVAASNAAANFLVFDPQHQH